MSTHLALPLRVGANGSLAALPVDSPREVAQSVAVLLVTPLGDRRAEPLYGSIDQLFVPVGDVMVDTSAIARWEPRATDDLIETTVAAVIPIGGDQ